MAMPVETRPWRRLSGILAITAAGSLVMGLALPVLPLYVTERLGLGPLVVGLAAGAQFAASLVSRVASGRYADRSGGGSALIVGLVLAAASGVLCLSSLALASVPLASAAVLIVGRAVLGVAQSYLQTGALIAGLALVAPSQAGTVMSWIGTAMYGALAGGAPLGVLVYEAYGFGAIGVLTIAFPLAALPLALATPAATRRSVAALSVGRVIRAVWLPGLGLACSSLGFGATTAFVTLLYAVRGWEPVWVPFTAFAVAFMLTRIALGHLPDRLGGARVALVCVVVEAAGQALLFWAGDPFVATAGAALTGVGYSLVFPGLGVEAVRRVAPEHRGLAMGTYTAFLDIALGMTSPALGYAAAAAGAPSVFAVSALCILGGVPVALALMARSRASGP
jgi:MFS family permease